MPVCFCKLCTLEDDDLVGIKLYKNIFYIIKFKGEEKCKYDAEITESQSAVSVPAPPVLHIWPWCLYSLVVGHHIITINDIISIL